MSHSNGQSHRDTYQRITTPFVSSESTRSWLKLQQPLNFLYPYQSGLHWYKFSWMLMGLRFFSRVGKYLFFPPVRLMHVWACSPICFPYKAKHLWWISVWLHMHALKGMCEDTKFLTQEDCPVCLQLSVDVLASPIYVFMDMAFLWVQLCPLGVLDPC